MELKYILLIGMMLCGIGIASAANNSTVSMDFVDWSAVKTAAGGFWESTDGLGNTIIAICAVFWLAAVVGSILIGGGKQAIGGLTQNAGQTSSGEKGVSAAAMAGIIVPIAILIVMVFVGTI